MSPRCQFAVRKPHAAGWWEREQYLNIWTPIPRVYPWSYTHKRENILVLAASYQDHLNPEGLKIIWKAFVTTDTLKVSEATNHPIFFKCEGNRFNKCPVISYSHKTYSLCMRKRFQLWKQNSMSNAICPNLIANMIEMPYHLHSWKVRILWAQTLIKNGSLRAPGWLS